MDVTPSGLFIPRVINSTTSSSTERVFRYESRIPHSETGIRAKTQFWASRGMVRIVDENTGKAQSVSRKTFLRHAIALNDTIPYCPYADVKNDMRRLVSCMEEVARAAGDQGDPVAAMLVGAKRNEYEVMRHELPPVPGRHLPIEDPEALCALPLSVPINRE